MKFIKILIVLSLLSLSIASCVTNDDRKQIFLKEECRIDIKGEPCDGNFFECVFVFPIFEFTIETASEGISDAVDPKEAQTLACWHEDRNPPCDRQEIWRTCNRYENIFEVESPLPRPRHMPF